MTVCIAEKPSVAKEIAGVLGARSKKDGYFEGNGYQVTWTYGHLCTLKSPDKYRPEWKFWKMDVLPMVPEAYGLELIDGASIRKQFKTIKELFKKADTIINCGDAAQEGELIQRYVMEMAGVKKSTPIKRLWISSLTEEAIRQGFRDLRPQSDFDSLYEAGQARSDGDWLLGMNATRLYTLKYGGRGQVLSIGRVQTPTLSMIVDRDRQISNFVPEPYWVLTTKYRGAVFNCTKGKLQKEQDGTSLLNAVLGKSLRIDDVQQKKGSEQAPQLYDLTALQVDCNRKFGMSADLTLKTIQSLYEKKLTTYPRVDTKYLTDDIYKKCRQILGSLQGYDGIINTLLCDGRPLQKSRRVFDNSKVTDHHAIIPTGEKPGDITDIERRVYDLVTKRFIAVFCPDCQYAQTTVLASSAGVPFKATGRTILSEGWRAVYGKTVRDEEENENGNESENENAALPVFTAGEQGQHVPSLDRKMTTPPKAFTEASLLQAMETAGKLVDDETLREAMKENGIGRPSSRAGIIETLLKRGYIVRDKKQLRSTATGRDLMNVVDFDMLKSPELTGQWEKKLRDIEHGRYTWQQFMSELEAQLREIIDSVKGDSTGRTVHSSSSDAPATRGSQAKKYRRR